MSLTTVTVLGMSELFVTPRMLSIRYHLLHLHLLSWRTCHPKRGDKRGGKQHYSCWQWNYWNRWGGVLSAPGLVERVHWHHLLQWSWWTAFCLELLWGTRWRRFDDHGRWSAAKEAKEGSEQRVSLLLRSVLFLFRYLVFCSKIILGIKYHTFYNFEVYWYLVGKISGILVSHYPPWPGLTFLKIMELQISCIYIRSLLNAQLWALFTR